MSEQKLFLKIDPEGKVESHPILEGNMADLFQDFDPNNPPENFVRFEKTPIPQLTDDQQYDYLTYELSPELTEKNGTPTWHEVHHIKVISKDEREKIIEEFKKMNPELQDWVYDEETKTLIPPVAMPQDGKTYFWNTNEHRWMESLPEMHLEGMIDIAKEIGYDLAAGRFGRPNVTQEMVDSIIAQMKKEGK